METQKDGLIQQADPSTCPHTRRSGGDGQPQPLGSPFGSRIPPPGPPGPDGKLTGRSQEPERGADAGTGHRTAVQTAWDRGGWRRQRGTMGGDVCSVGQRTTPVWETPRERGVAGPPSTAGHGGRAPSMRTGKSRQEGPPRGHVAGAAARRRTGSRQAPQREGRGRRTAGREATAIGTRKLDTSPEQPGSRVTFSGFRGGCRGLRNEKAQTCFPRSAWSEEGGSFSK